MNIRVKKVIDCLDKDWKDRLEIEYNENWGDVVDIIIKDVLRSNEMRKILSLKEAHVFIFRKGYDAIMRIWL